MQSHISKLDLADISESADNFSPYFIGNVELGQGHVRRAEEGVLWNRHGEGKCLCFPGGVQTRMPGATTLADPPESILKKGQAVQATKTSEGDVDG